MGVYLVGVYPQACISWACTSLRVPHWYVRYGHAPHWHASHRRVHHGRRDHDVGRESSSHVCKTNCVRAQVHLVILSLALFVLMIRHHRASQYFEPINLQRPQITLATQPSFLDQRPISCFSPSMPVPLGALSILVLSSCKVSTRNIL